MDLKNIQKRLHPDGLLLRKNYKNHTGLFFLFALSIVFLFYGLGDFRTLGSHEGYSAVPAQEMLDSGDWIVPQFGNMPRLQKPPLSYWVIATTSKFTVGKVTEWTARFPSAVAALLLSCLMAFWAGKWYGRKAGIAAGLIQATSIYVLIYGRKAEIDMLLCLLTTSSLFLVATEDPAECRLKNFFRWGLFFVLLSFSWLGKFHYGMAMVLAPVVIYFIIQKQYWHFLKFLHPIGLPILLGAVMIWPYLVMKELPAAKGVFLRETVGRASGKLGYDPVWFYIPRLITCCLPWFPFAVYAMPGSLKKAFKRCDAKERFLWIWIIVDLSIITLQPMKHAHYLLATLPAMTLLASQPIASAYYAIKKKHIDISPEFFKWWIIALLVTGGGGVLWLVQWNAYFAEPILVLVLFVLMLLLLTNLLFYKRMNRIAVASLVVLIMGAYAIVNDQLVPLLDSRQQIAAFAKEVSGSIPDEENIWAYKTGMDPIVFYLECPVYRAESKDEIESVLKKKNHLYILAREPELKGLTYCGEMTVVQKMEVKTDSIKPRCDDFIVVRLNKVSEFVSSEY